MKLNFFFRNIKRESVLLLKKMKFFLINSNKKYYLINWIDESTFIKSAVIERDAFFFQSYENNLVFFNLTYPAHIMIKCEAKRESEILNESVYFESVSYSSVWFHNDKELHEALLHSIYQIEENYESASLHKVKLFWFHTKNY